MLTDRDGLYRLRVGKWRIFHRHISHHLPTPPFQCDNHFRGPYAILTSPSRTLLRPRPNPPPSRPQQPDRQHVRRHTPRPAQSHRRPRPTPEDTRQQLLADLQTLIAEAQSLQHDLTIAPAVTLSAQSVKRSQKLETLSKRIRKNLKPN